MTIPKIDIRHFVSEKTNEENRNLGTRPLFLQPKQLLHQRGSPAYGIYSFALFIYLVSSQIQFVSHVLPPSAEKACSIRADFGEIFNQT